MAEDNKGIESLGKNYANKNPELRRLSLYAFEAAKNTVREGSSGATIGADQHFPKRQKTYVEGFQILLANIKAQPVPDAFGMPDIQYPIDLSAVPQMITTDKNGSEVPLNEDLQLITIDWYTLAVQLARSDSAGWRGSMNDHDHTRADNQAALILKRISEIEAGPKPDFTATSDPGAKRSGTA